MSFSMHSLCGSWMDSSVGLSASPSDASFLSDRSSVASSSDPSFASTYSRFSSLSEPSCVPLTLPLSGNQSSLAHLSVPFQPRAPTTATSAFDSPPFNALSPTAVGQVSAPSQTNVPRPCFTCVAVRAPCNGCRPCDRCVRLGNQLDCRDHRSPKNSADASLFQSFSDSSATLPRFPATPSIPAQSPVSTPVSQPTSPFVPTNQSTANFLNASPHTASSSSATSTSLHLLLSAQPTGPITSGSAANPASAPQTPLHIASLSSARNTSPLQRDSPQSPLSEGSSVPRASLPQAKAEVMRVYNDSYYDVLHKIHRKASDPNARDPHLVGAMAHLVHTLSCLSVQYEQALRESSKGCEITEIHDTTSPTHNQSPSSDTPSDPPVPSASTWHAKPLSSDDEYGPLTSAAVAPRGPPAPPACTVASIGYSQGPSGSMQIPRPIKLHHSQNLMLFLKAYLSPELHSDFAHSVSDKVISLPQLQLPSMAAASEIRVYAIINCWRNMKHVRAVIQRFYAGPSPIDMETNLQAERFRCHNLPFGVVVLPLYPRGFVKYPPWTNDRLAAMLKYEPQRLLQIASTRRSFFSLYHPDSMTAGHVLPIAALAAGKTRFSLRMDYVRSDGSTLRSITSVMMRYFDSMPMYAVMFIQELPSRLH